MEYTCQECGGKMKKVGLALFECEKCGADAYLLDDEGDELVFDSDLNAFDLLEIYDKAYRQFD